MELENSLQLTKESLSQLLHLNVMDFISNPGGISLGDNYMSNLYCLEIRTEGDDKPIQLIVKSFPIHPSRQDFLKKSNLFWKEYSAYLEIIPVIQETCQFELPFPKFYGGIAPNFWDSDIESIEIKPTDALIFLEDLRPKCFKMANRLESLDFNHVSLIVQALAKFHASTWILKQKTNIPSLHENFPLVEIRSQPEDQMVLDNIIINNIQNLIDSIENNPAHEKYASALKAFQKYVPKVMEIMYTSKERNIFELEELHRNLERRTEKNRELWKVGGHGDCWTNNALFRYKINEEKVPEEVMLIDLQLINESCPVIDLVYFIYISTDTQFRLAHVDAILELYYREFMKHCNNMEVEPMNDFSLEELKYRFHVTKVFGFSISMLVLPIILKEAENAVDLENMSTGNLEGFNVVFESLCNVQSVHNGLRYQKRILDLVKELNDENVL